MLCIESESSSTIARLIGVVPEASFHVWISGRAIARANKIGIKQRTNSRSNCFHWIRLELTLTEESRNSIAPQSIVMYLLRLSKWMISGTAKAVAPKASNAFKKVMLVPVLQCKSPKQN